MDDYKCDESQIISDQIISVNMDYIFDLYKQKNEEIKDTCSFCKLEFLELTAQMLEEPEPLNIIAAINLTELIRNHPDSLKELSLEHISFYFSQFQNVLIQRQSLFIAYILLKQEISHDILQLIADHHLFDVIGELIHSDESEIVCCALSCVNSVLISGNDELIQMLVSSQIFNSIAEIDSDSLQVSRQIAIIILKILKFNFDDLNIQIHQLYLSKIHQNVNSNDKIIIEASIYSLYFITKCYDVSFLESESEIANDFVRSVISPFLNVRISALDSISNLIKINSQYTHIFLNLDLFKKTKDVIESMSQQEIKKIFSLYSIILDSNVGVFSVYIAEIAESLDFFNLIENSNISTKNTLIPFLLNVSTWASSDLISKIYSLDLICALQNLSQSADISIVSQICSIFLIICKKNDSEEILNQIFCEEYGDILESSLGIYDSKNNDYKNVDAFLDFMAEKSK